MDKFTLSELFPPEFYAPSPLPQLYSFAMGMMKHVLACPLAHGLGDIAAAWGQGGGGWLLTGVHVTLLSSSATPPGVQGSGTPMYQFTDCSHSAFRAA